jgi:hypothetical protein
MYLLLVVFLVQVTKSKLNVFNIEIEVWETQPGNHVLRLYKACYCVERHSTAQYGEMLRCKVLSVKCYVIIIIIIIIINSGQLKIIIIIFIKINSA